MQTFLSRCYTIWSMYSLRKSRLFTHLYSRQPIIQFRISIKSSRGTRCTTLRHRVTQSVSQIQATECGPCRCLRQWCNQLIFHELCHAMVIVLPTKCCAFAMSFSHLCRPGIEFIRHLNIHSQVHATRSIQSLKRETI